MQRFAQEKMVEGIGLRLFIVDDNEELPLE